MAGKVRVCPNCGGQFFPRSSRQTFCDPHCRNGWKWRQEQEELRKAEAQRNVAIIAEWRKREHLKRSVCKQCFRTTWTETEEEFCCDACRIIYYGGNPQKVR